MPETVALQFIDGPLKGIGNTPTAASGVSSIVAEFEWPLPNDIFIEHTGLELKFYLEKPETSFDLFHYVKLDESKLTDEEVAQISIMVRGVKYGFQARC
jgi:hypothetical protein